MLSQKSVSASSCRNHWSSGSVYSNRKQASYVSVVGSKSHPTNSRETSRASTDHRTLSGWLKGYAPPVPAGTSDQIARSK